MARFQVLNESQSSHCCFVATVIDTDQCFTVVNGKRLFLSICECFSEEDAVRIAVALNAYFSRLSEPLNYN